MGIAVLVSSIKFNDAQNSPERIFVSFFQFEDTLKENEEIKSLKINDSINILTKNTQLKEVKMVYEF